VVGIGNEQLWVEYKIAGVYKIQVLKATAKDEES
jgi:hypothetical protein